VPTAFAVQVWCIGTAHHKMPKVDKKRGGDDGGRRRTACQHIHPNKLRTARKDDSGHGKHIPKHKANFARGHAQRHADRQIAKHDGQSVICAN